MTEKELTGKVEVAHITGIQGIRAAMEVLEREATQEGEADVPAAGATPRTFRWGVAPAPSAPPTTTAPAKPAGTAARRFAACGRGVMEVRREAYRGLSFWARSDRLLRQQRKSASFEALGKLR